MRARNRPSRASAWTPPRSVGYAPGGATGGGGGSTTLAVDSAQTENQLVELPGATSKLASHRGVLASAPAAEAGAIYKNSGDGKTYICHDGSTWEALN